MDYSHFSLSDLKRLAAQVIERHYAKAAELFPGLPAPEVLFNLRGRAAGKFEARGLAKTPRSSWAFRIRINPEALHKDPADTIENTIPHELAHLVEFYVFGKSGHGPRWKEIMSEVFGIEDAKRCHSLKLTKARSVKRDYIYKCACREHGLTAIMHNKIRKGSRRACKFCRDLIVYVGQREMR